MLEQLHKIKSRYEEISQQLSSPEIISDRTKLTDLSKEQAELEETITKITELEKVENDLTGAQELLGDPDMKADAEKEISKLQAKKKQLEENLKFALVPKDPNDSKNAIMEIRAGAGGDESGLFAAELFRAYSKYAENQGWTINIMNSSRTGIGGYKEIILEINGRNVFAKLKYERGVHRVQRVPETEKSGRVHTSTVTVAVMPEAEESDIAIKSEDLRIDIFRSSGPGGQSVNTTDSAVRITHLPTDTVVTCQDEKSQHKNKDKAMRVLRSRLAEAKEEERAKKESDLRRSQVGTGDRSEKIRTYNFPQDRVTDHRIKLSLKNLPDIMEGNLERLITPLAEADKEAKLIAMDEK
ncbi:peptide chain release factor 1 [Patescibacteria group bacterium]